MLKRNYLIVTLLTSLPMVFAIMTLLGYVNTWLATFAFIIIAYCFLGISWFILRPLYNVMRHDPLLHQVQALSENLERAGEVSALLNVEIQNRVTELDRLRVQNDVARKILDNLSLEEYEAVVAAIQAQSRVKSRVKELRDLVFSFLLGVSTNIFTFLLIERTFGK